VTAPLASWVRGRSARERRLLAVAAGAGALVLATQLGAVVAGDLADARLRVQAAERDLAAVRRLVRELGASHGAPRPAPDAPLVSRLEAAASSVVGRERIASMTPTLGRPEGVALRLVGTTLAEAVQLLYDVEASGDRVTRLEMVKHPDYPGRFDLTLEIATAAP
jgi:hypothetical protein